MTRSSPKMPAPEAIVITMSVPNRLAVNGEGALPTGVPARNQGALVAIDHHQTAAAMVITGIQIATATASIESTLSLARPTSSLRVAAAAAAAQVKMVAANRIPMTTNMSWYHPNPSLRC